MNLSWKGQLALKAALSPIEEAKLSWIELLKIQEFHKMDHEISRIVPAIYSNLHSNTEIPDISALLGVGKRTWAHNQRMMTSISEALADEIEINYRLLKGAALLLLDSNLTSRSMGDIDLLVSRRDLRRISNALVRSGFSNEHLNFCSHAEFAFEGPEISFLNQSGVQVDLHVMERHHLRGFFKQILKSPPQIKTFNGKSLKIPNVEYLFVHAVIHGFENIADGDDLQALVDLHKLLPMTDESELHSIIEESPNVRQIRSFLDENINEGFVADVERELNTSLSRGLIHNISAFRHKLSKVLRVLQMRRIRLADAIPASKNFGSKKWLYLLWLIIGKPRNMERFVCQVFSGFMNVKTSSNLGRCGKAQEVRFSIVRNESAQYLSIIFKSELLKKTSFLLFRNGSLVTTIGGKGSSAEYFETKLTSKSDEYSLRLGAMCCAFCAPKFNDIRIDFNYV